MTSTRNIAQGLREDYLFTRGMIATLNDNLRKMVEYPVTLPDGVEDLIRDDPCAAIDLLRKLIVKEESKLAKLQQVASSITPQ